MIRRSLIVLGMSSLLLAIMPNVAQAHLVRPAVAVSDVGSVDLLADIRGGSNSSGSVGGVTLNGRYLFFADDGSTGTELWATDGTTAGTSMLKDIRTGSTSSSPRDFFQVSASKAFFSADNGTTGLELWVTDGTAAGTTLVKDINPGSNGSSPRNYLVFGNQVLFAATTTNEGEELWITDGTTAGTSLAKDIRSGNSSNPSDMVVYNGMVLFQADDGVNGHELWKTDGTTAGTTMIKDIYPGSQYGYYNSGYPMYMTVVGGKVVFQALTGTDGYELWVTDGSAANTQMLMDINTIAAGGGGTLSSNPRDFRMVGSRLVFTADNGTNGTELWETDGTVAGTRLVVDIYPGSNGSYPNRITLINNKIYFFAQDGVHGNEPYVSDGTANGTISLGDLNPGSSGSFVDCYMCSPPKASFTAFGDKALFAATNATYGAEPWITDGTPSGTRLLVDLRSGSTGSLSAGMYSSPVFDYYGTSSFFAVFQGRAIFNADNGTTGAEPWVLTSPPSAPRNVTASASPTSVDVSWQIPANIGSTPITSYTVVSNPGAFTCTTATLTCTVSGLLSNQDYTFSVTATSPSGSSPTAVSARVRTPSPQLGSLVGSLTSVSDIVSDPNLRAGDPLTVLYRGFNPSELVLLMLASNPVVIGSANADANGNVAFNTAVPTGTTAGAHHLLIYAPVSGFGASQAVTVTAAASGSAGSAGSSGAGSSGSSSAGSAGSSTSGTVDPSSLPATGRGDAPAVFALYVLVAGLLAMRLRRRALPVRGNHPR